MRDVVGVYLDPPDRALVCCVDENADVEAQFARVLASAPSLTGTPRGGAYIPTDRQGCQKSSWPTRGASPFESASPRLAWEHTWTFWNEWCRKHAAFDYEPNCPACAFREDTLCSNTEALSRRLGRRLFRPVLVCGRRLQVEARSRGLKHDGRVHT